MNEIEVTVLSFSDIVIKEGHSSVEELILRVMI